MTLHAKDSDITVSGSDKHFEEAHLWKQYNRVDAIGPGLCNSINKAVPPSKPRYPRHGIDGNVLFSIMNENWKD